jgi:hypothetical protein
MLRHHIDSFKVLAKTKATKNLVIRKLLSNTHHWVGMFTMEIPWEKAMSSYDRDSVKFPVRHIHRSDAKSFVHQWNALQA